MSSPGAEGTLDLSRTEELGRCGFALAMQLLRNREDAADAVQDSLHALLRKRRLFNPKRGDLRAWFLKIVRNRCIDQVRKRDRRPEESGEVSDIAYARGMPPEDVAETREEMELLRRELMAMPSDQREVILLRDFHNLSYAEIATVLSVKVGTVMSRLHRARTELRKRVQQISE